MKDRPNPPSTPLPAEILIRSVTRTPRPSRVAPVISNRHTPRIELPVTHSKQATVVLSNRYKKLPPGGVAFWLPHPPTLRISNRNRAETGFPLIHRKQTTAVLSNRNKKTPPGAWHSSYPGETQENTDANPPHHSRFGPRV